MDPNDVILRFKLWMSNDSEIAVRVREILEAGCYKAEYEKQEEVDSDDVVTQTDHIIWISGLSG